MPLESETKKEHQKQIYLSIAAFILPALGVLSCLALKMPTMKINLEIIYRKHRCKEIGSTITAGFSKERLRSIQ
ncbi:MAG: hypothetical protein V9E91_05730 [Burkholderiaceae bacterium]